MYVIRLDENMFLLVNVYMYKSYNMIRKCYAIKLIPLSYRAFT